MHTSSLTSSSQRASRSPRWRRRWPRWCDQKAFESCDADVAGRCFAGSFAPSRAGCQYTVLKAEVRNTAAMKQVPALLDALDSGLLSRDACVTAAVSLMAAVSSVAHTSPLATNPL